MPTLQDVAKKAGVSTATVSKVLSNTPYVRDETRQRVLEAVKEIGYRPNLAARALSSGRTNIIAVVFPYIYDTIFKDPLVMSILEGIETVCTSMGYNLLLSTPRFDYGSPDENYMQLMQSGYIEGLIAIDNAEISFAAEAEKYNIPTVVQGYHSGDYAVYSDDYLGGQMIMECVLEHGHEKIGLISVPLSNNIAISKRIEGMQSVLEQAGLESQVTTVISDFSTQGGAEAAAELLASNPDISVIVCLNDRMAMGAITYLHGQGKIVPDDISVVGYDNIGLAALTRPPLTTIDQNANELGTVAAELLFKRLHGETPSTVVLSPQLILRESLAMRR